MWKKVLLTLMVATMMAVSPAMAAGTLTISGSSSMYKLVGDLAAGYNTAHPSDTISFINTESDSQAGINDVAAGRVNIGDSSRELNPSMEPGLVATAICKDADFLVAMIVNPRNTFVEQSHQSAGCRYL